MKPATRLIMGIWAAGLLYGFMRSHTAVPSWGCPLLELTGIPCPTCGGTRALGALTRLDLHEALLWNPLVTVAWIAAPLLGLVMEREPVWWSALVARLGPARIVAGCAAVLLLNWILLIGLRHV